MAVSNAHKAQYEEALASAAALKGWDWQHITGSPTYHVVDQKTQQEYLFAAKVQNIGSEEGGPSPLEHDRIAQLMKDAKNWGKNGPAIPVLSYRYTVKKQRIDDFIAIPLDLHPLLAKPGGVFSNVKKGKAYNGNKFLQDFSRMPPAQLNLVLAAIRFDYQSNPLTPLHIMA